MGDPLEDFAYRAVGHQDRERIDAAAVEVMGALAEEGVSALLLKGPVTARWLYDPSEVRGYSDCDVLAAPDRFASAARAMQEAGFHMHVDEATHPEVRDEGTSQIWHRQPEDLWVDLQWRLPGFGLAPGRAWELLWAGREAMELAGDRVTIAGEPARALQLATVVGTDPELRKPLIDLERAIARVDADVWRRAVRLAEQVQAVQAFRAGLSRAGGGTGLIERLESRRCSP